MLASFFHAMLQAARTQSFEPGDLAIIGVLVLLEGLLSIDNALVLGILARRVSPAQRGKVLSYGLVGAFIFRLLAIVAASWLLRSSTLMLLGGLYLIALTLRHFFWEKQTPPRPGPIVVAAGRAVRLDAEDFAAQSTAKSESAHFWRTVLVIELTDLAVAVDSILAAVALVSQYAPTPWSGTHPKLWLVVVGGMIGVILMRVTAAIFIKLLNRFPRFETAAYLLVLLIGLKLIAVWACNAPGRPPRLDFHSAGSPAFWVFWGLMAVGFSVGFVPKRS